ncbi:MAG: DUF938 domain-containing protein [Rhodobacter sp.]|nr:DUF938 domain-containing protein [Rhodobacter sp.]
MRGPAQPDSWSRAEGDRRVAPSAERNLEPIAGVLAGVLPATGRVLELASGSGQHVAAFASRWPGLVWQPSDANPDNFASIRSWGAGLPNLCDPLLLNACAPGWGRGDADAVLLANLLHLISTPEAETLLHEAAQALAPGGVFALYGPFRRDGRLVTEGDVAFDARLKHADPAIGYKDIAWVRDRLAGAGLRPVSLTEMPAGNLMLVTRRD